MSLTLLQEFTRRTGIRDGKVDAILIAQAALPKFWNGIQLPRTNARDWMMTTVAPPQNMQTFRPNKWQVRYWSTYLGVDHSALKGIWTDSITAPIRATDDEIRRMVDELIEGHHTGDMPCES